MCRVIGFWLLGLSIPFAFLSNLTGEKAALIAGGKSFPTHTLELLRLHESLSDVLTLGSPIFFVLWIFFFFRNMENKRIDHLALAFLGLLSAIALATGYLGIQLVYIHSVGVP